MKSSLLDLIFRSLHAHPDPVLWHEDCAPFSDELADYLARNILIEAAPARRLPAARKPQVGVDLDVRTLSDGRIIGIGRDAESPTEIVLTADDIRRYAISIPAVATALRDASGLRGGVASRFDDGLLPLGERPDPAGPVRVYLAAPVASGDDLLARCRRLHALHPKRRVAILTFCAVAMDVTLEEEFDGRLSFTLHTLRDVRDRPAWAPVWPADTDGESTRTEADYVFRKRGAAWEIVFAGRLVTLPKPGLIGLAYLHYAISHAGDAIPVETLIAECSPHPDQISPTGHVTALLSGADDVRPSAANLRQIKARRQQLAGEVDTASTGEQLAIRRQLQQIDAYLREHDRARRSTDKSAVAKRVSVARAIALALKSFPPALQRHFAKPSLSLGFKISYLRTPGVDWVTK